jgi:hypothetical protein
VLIAEGRNMIFSTLNTPRSDPFFLLRKSINVIAKDRKMMTLKYSFHPRNSDLAR